tara:strand:- start:93 stop:446 length:354 start_codon:yes stop_codon:yes gene_type:complete
MIKKEVVIFHNPRCSKSRKALDILQENGISPKIVQYLKKPPTKEEISLILQKLNKEPIDIIRKNETFYKENLKSLSLDREGWIETLSKHPILIERPIIIRGEKAVLGRPPENVLKLI